MITPSALNGIGDDGNAADTNVLRITVQVSYGNDTVTLDGYRTRYAPNHL
jgi:MSHA pilin protein MshD